MYSLEQYIDYYNTKGYFPDGQYNNPDKKLNYGQLKHKYEKYVRKTERKEEKKGQVSNYMQNIYDVEAQCRADDCAAVQFWNALTEEEDRVVTLELKKLLDFRKVDPAHIISRTQAPHMSAEPLNIMMVPRAFHHYIDKFLNPFTEKHESITREEQDAIWIHLIGIDRWNKLQAMRRKEV